MVVEWRVVRPAEFERHVLSMKTMSTLTDITTRTNHLRLDPCTEATVVVVATSYSSVRSGMPPPVSTLM